MATENNYQVRTMRRDELDTVLQWAAREGWNPGLHDARCFHAADPEGFLVGLLDGMLVASISVVRYGPNYGFLGLYIVVPEHRGKGYGWALWQAGLKHLGCRAVGLDGVLAQQDNYRRSGFELEHRNIRYTTASPAHLGRAEAAEHPDLVDLRRLAAAQVQDYDRPFFPAGRDAFLQAWLHAPGHHALGMMRDGRLAAYGVIRPCLSGYKIGPLFADRHEQAQTLLQALMARIPAGSAIFLDVPETNAAALELARSHGMEPMFETARMYKGKPALPDMGRTFGITSFELG
jgi:ribosomal protein S18 acetylase RimI-like enzyme